MRRMKYLLLQQRMPLIELMKERDPSGVPPNIWYKGFAAVASAV